VTQKVDAGGFVQKKIMHGNHGLLDDTSFMPEILAMQRPAG